jgi:CRP/FNR family transcriptional regulator, nitrogen fixation regulation protein
MLNPSIQYVGIVRSYAREREIVHENDPADCVYEVISGTVCTSKMLREGRRQVTGFYFPGDVFGLESAKNTASPPKRSPTLSFGFSKNKH